MESLIRDNLPTAISMFLNNERVPLRQLRAEEMMTRTGTCSNNDFANALERKLLYIWMLLSAAYMLVLPFVNRTHPYNTVASAYLYSPMITDDADKEAAHYTTLLVGIHNVTVVVVVLSLYATICVYIDTFDAHNRTNSRQPPGCCELAEETLQLRL
ncbi:hypothetical protein COOONC_02718 [Cooperia oncophora]